MNDDHLRGQYNPKPQAAQNNPFAILKIIEERNSALDMCRRLEGIIADLQEQLEAFKRVGEVSYDHGYSIKWDDSVRLPCKQLTGGTEVYIKEKAK